MDIEEIKLTLFTDDTIMCLEKLKRINDKLTQTAKEFGAKCTVRRHNGGVTFAIAMRKIKCY